MRNGRLADSIMRAIEEHVGTEAWQKLSTEERNRKYKVFRGDCWQHLRNIVIEAMTKVSARHACSRACTRACHPTTCTREPCLTFA